MKIYLSLILIVLNIAAVASAQKPVKTQPAKPDPFILKKQIFVDDIESQLGQVQYAAVRVNIRYRLAAWLWKTGKDDTDRAEALAIKAVEELYSKIDEIPPSNASDLSNDLFALLDKNAPETAARLRKKYIPETAEDIYGVYGKIKTPGGDKKVAAAATRFLSETDAFDDMIPLILSKMNAVNSPQIPIVLSAMLDAMESGRMSYNIDSLRTTFSFFPNPAVPAALQRRFFLLVLNKAREALQAETLETNIYYTVLGNTIDGLGKSAPDIIDEARAIRSALAARESRTAAERHEAEERIDEATDKLSAIIDEAEKTNNEGYKTELYIGAMDRATNEGKFSVALDVIEKLRQVSKREFIVSLTDNQLSEIAARARAKDDLVSARKAIERILDGLRRAEAWKVAAVYFEGKKDLLNSREALDQALKLWADESKENPLRVFALIRAIPDVQKIDRGRVTELIVLASKAINDLPTPGVDDKPGTAGYQRYLSSILIINRNIAEAMPGLFKENKAEAEDFVGRVQGREMRVFADLIIGIAALDAAQKAAEKKPAAK